MKIYSKEHDYYDVAMRNHDDSIQYPRKSEIIAIDNKRNPHFEQELIKKHKKLVMPFGVRDAKVPFGYNRNGDVNIRTIFFCGKIYFCFITDVVKRKCLYTLERVKKELGKKNLIKRDPQSILWWGYSIADVIKNTSMYYSESAVLDIHKKYNSPIVEVGNFGHDTDYKIGISKDCILKDIEFFKAFDVYTAFQEIEMFLGSGVLKGIGVHEDGNVQIADKYMIPQKGFNKHSFRKDVDTRRRKQKKGKVHHRQR